MPREQRLVAILSADIVGYTRRMAADEDATIDLLTRFRARVDAIVTDAGGRVVDFVGDEFLAEFPSARAAVASAVGVQAAVAEFGELELRAGIHLGDVSVEGGRLYGAGVIVAARLQALADPGAVWISAAVRDQVEGRLELAFHDRGTRRLKGLPEPIHIFSIEAKGAVQPAVALGAATRPPAVAVLLFENLSASADDEYFAHGIAEDLITRLSRAPVFPVVARNSSFALKGKSLSVKQIGVELGARYVVEGSVRRAERRVRIAVRLIDAETGHHAWADTFDRELDDILRVQDEIAGAVASAVGFTMWGRELDRAAQRESASLDAWDQLARGSWHARKSTREHLDLARACWNRALELDPNLAIAHAFLASAHHADLSAGWSQDREQSLALLEHHSQRAIALDPSMAEGHVTLAFYLNDVGDAEEALAQLRIATALAPHDPAHFTTLGQVCALTGRYEEAVQSLERARELSPRGRDPGPIELGIATAQFCAGHYEDCVREAREAVRRGTRNPYLDGLITAACAQLGRPGDASAEAGRLGRVDAGALRGLLSSAQPDVLTRLLDGLRAAGVELV